MSQRRARQVSVRIPTTPGHNPQPDPSDTCPAEPPTQTINRHQVAERRVPGLAHSLASGSASRSTGPMHSPQPHRSYQSQHKRGTGLFWVFRSSVYPNWMMGKVPAPRVSATIEWAGERHDHGCPTAQVGNGHTFEALKRSRLNIATAPGDGRLLCLVGLFPFRAICVLN